MWLTRLSKRLADLSMTIRWPPSVAQPLASRAGVFRRQALEYYAAEGSFSSQVQFLLFSEEEGAGGWQKASLRCWPEKGRERSDSGVHS